MASIITARPLWIPILFENDGESVTLLGSPPMIAKGAECRLHLSIFKDTGSKSVDDPGEVFDISNFAAFIFKIWASDYGSGTLLLDTSDAAAITAGASITYNQNATAAEFFGRTLAQIEVYLPAAITANVTAGDRYGVFTGATTENAAQPDYLGRCLVTCKEVGLSTAASPPSPASAYVSSEVFQAAINQCVRFGTNPAGKTFTLVSPNGSYGRTHGCTDDGESQDDLEQF